MAGPLAQFTPDQLFFMSWQHVWCTAGNVVSKWRGGTPMQQEPAFAQAFKCPQGSPMAPRDTCHVWKA